MLKIMQKEIHILLVLLVSKHFYFNIFLITVTTYNFLNNCQSNCINIFTGNFNYCTLLYIDKNVNYKQCLPLL